MYKAEVTAFDNLYAASSILRRTVILKAEKLNVTCNDLALTSQGQTRSGREQTAALRTKRLPLLFHPQSMLHETYI